MTKIRASNCPANIHEMSVKQTRIELKKAVAKEERLLKQWSDLGFYVGQLIEHLADCLNQPAGSILDKEGKPAR